MSGNAAEIPATVKSAKDVPTYTLSQLQEKISEKTVFAADLKYVRDNITCRFQKCNEKQPPALLGSKLYVGSYSPKDQAVWAHIRVSAAKGLTKVNHYVTYWLENGGLLRNEELKNVTFAEPFSFIDGSEQAAKIRHLVLYFFLEHGYTDSIELAKRGLDSFRIAIATVAKAHVQAKDISNQSSLSKEPAPYLPAKAICLDTAKQAQASIPAVIPDPEVTTETIPTTACSSKRKQSPDSEDVKTERPAKRSAEDDGLYHLSKLMEVLKGQTSDEIGSLKARNEQLETNLHQLKEQRDTWESDANFVREQLRDSEQRRHEAETKLDESERRRISLEAANVKTVKDIEQKDEQLKGWEVTMRLHWGKTEATQKELEHLRALKKQLLNLVANLRGGESST